MLPPSGTNPSFAATASDGAFVSRARYRIDRDGRQSVRDHRAGEPRPQPASADRRVRDEAHVAGRAAEVGHVAHRRQVAVLERTPHDVRILGAEAALVPFRFVDVVAKRSDGVRVVRAEATSVARRRRHEGVRVEVRVAGRAEDEPGGVADQARSGVSCVEHVRIGTGCAPADIVGDVRWRADRAPVAESQEIDPSVARHPRWVGDHPNAGCPELRCRPTPNHSDHERSTTSRIVTEFGRTGVWLAPPPGMAFRLQLAQPDTIRDRCVRTRRTM